MSLMSSWTLDVTVNQQERINFFEYKSKYISMLLLLQFGEPKSLRINTVEECKGFNNFAKFKVSSKEGALLLNKIIEKYNIAPQIIEYTDECLELLHPSCVIYATNESDLLNRYMCRFNKVKYYNRLNANSHLMELILDTNSSILEKIDLPKINIDKSSQLNKLGHLDKAIFIIENAFLPDEEIYVKHIENILIKLDDDKILVDILEQIGSIGHLGISSDKSKLISPDINITELNIVGPGNRILYLQNIADNKYIKDLTSKDVIHADFEDNYTLLEYTGRQESINRIVMRNQELLNKSRFIKTKAIMDH